MTNPYAMTPRQVAKEYGVELPHCGDSACVFGGSTEMQTNGGCRCDGKAVPSSATMKLRSGIAVLQDLVKRVRHDLAATATRRDEAQVALSDLIDEAENVIGYEADGTPTFQPSYKYAPGLDAAIKAAKDSLDGGMTSWWDKLCRLLAQIEDTDHESGCALPNDGQPCDCILGKLRAARWAGR